MLWRSSRRRDDSAAARFRREHEAFLTCAFALDIRYPTIPTRRVDEGGFNRLRGRGGQARAERWWRLAMNAMDRKDAPARTRADDRADGPMNG